MPRANEARRKRQSAGTRRGSASARSARTTRAAKGARAATAAEIVERRARAAKIARLLKKMYPETGTALHYGSPFQLYVATVLSAQSTDELVNRVTPELFGRYPTATELAGAKRSSIETLIHATGFFRNKAKSIHEGAQRIVAEYDGKLPSTMEELVKIPGIGRKTANVILGNAFGVPSVTVDRHVQRVSQRLSLTRQQDPAKIEFDLMEILPRPTWTDFSFRLILHGRKICVARKPRCAICPLLPHCPYGQTLVKGAGAKPRRITRAAARSPQA